MTSREQGTAVAHEESYGGLTAMVEDSEDALGKPEPWEFWETKLVMWSLVIGIGALVVLGGIINITILSR